MACARVVPARRTAFMRFWSCFPFDGAATCSAACCARDAACASSLSRWALARLAATCLRRLRVALPMSFGAVVFFDSFSFMVNSLLEGFFCARREPGSVACGAWRQAVASLHRQAVTSLEAGGHAKTRQDVAVHVLAH